MLILLQIGCMRIVCIKYRKAFDSFLQTLLTHKINTVQCANTCAITHVYLYIYNKICTIYNIHIYIYILNVWHIMALVTYNSTICNDCKHAFTIHGMLWGCWRWTPQSPLEHSSCQEFQNILKFLQHFFVLSHAQNVREKQNLLLLLQK